MELEFKEATVQDANIIGIMVVNLTEEISELTNSKPFEINIENTIRTCEELISEGHYTALIAWSENTPIAISTITESYALYAGGKIGIIQEFYVIPECRSSGVGTMLIEHIREYGIRKKWYAIELTTPPLPEFDRSLSFYQNNGLIPVGGRKMRQTLKAANK